MKAKIFDPLRFLNIVLYLWQLPQNIVAFLIWVFHDMFMVNRLLYSGKYIINGKKTNVTYYIYRLTNKKAKKNLYMGFSCGNKVFIYHNGNCKTNSNRVQSTVLRLKEHEYKHCIQSKWLGWLYLIVIAIPDLIFESISGDLSDRMWTETLAEKYTNKLRFEYEYN